MRNSVQLLNDIYITLTCPYAYGTVLSALDHIPISYTHALYDSRTLVFFGAYDASATVPLPTLDFVIHLDHVLARGADDPPRVEHHARDGVVVRVRVVYGACPEIPYLIARSALYRKEE